MYVIYKTTIFVNQKTESPLQIEVLGKHLQ